MITGLSAYYKSSGSKYLLATEGTNLWNLTSSRFELMDSGFTTSLDTWMELCPLNDKIYLANGTDYLHSWDGTSTTLNSCLTDLGASIPTGKVLKWHKNHMFMINDVALSGTTYYHRLYWSALGDPDTWDTSNDFISIPGNGNAVTLGDLGNALVIFKEHSIHYLTGWGDDDWRITATSSNTAGLSEKIGTLSPYGVTRVGNEIWFMDDEGQIRRIYQTDFDAYRSDHISKNIQGTLSDINKTYLSKVVATTWNDKVYFAIPTGSSTVNDTVLVYDILAAKRTGDEAWTTYTGWTVGKFTLYKTSSTPDLYIGDGDSIAVYKHTGTSDNGTAIDSRWDGKLDDYDRPERWKRYKFGYISGPQISDIDVGIYSSVDDAAFADLGDLNLTSTGGTLGPSGTFELGPTGTTAVLGGSGSQEFKFYYATGGGAVRGKTVRHSIRHATVDEVPIVGGFTSHFKERSLR